MATAGEVKARLTLENDDFKRKMNESKQGMNEMGSEAERTATSLKFIERSAMAVGAAVIGGIGASVKVAADFEQGMARVKAISGATDEEFAQLTATAREMGATTRFTSMDAADALTFLSMAGFSATQSIESLPGVLNLASAAQVDLGASADIVSNIMTGFGLSADETGRAVDVLVTTMTSANTDLPQLGGAMKMVAPVAKALGLDIEDTATAVAKMSDSGIQGSQAGTSLRAALISLANPTGQTEKAIARLGIEVTNADGAMKPLPELMGHIAGKLDGMTEAQKTQTVAQLVGREAASGFLALLEVGEEGLADYSQSLRDSAGAAQEMADIQNNTLLGSVDAFKSAMADVGISIGNEFLPVIREIVDHATDMTRSFGELDPATLALGLKMAGAASGVALAATSIVKLSGAIRVLYASMGPAGWLILGLSAAAAGFVAYHDSAARASEVNLDAANSMIESEGALRGQIERYDELNSKMRLSNDEFGKFIDYNDRIASEIDPVTIQALKDAQQELADKSGLTNEELDEMVGLNNELIAILPDSSTKITDQGNAVLDGTGKLKEYNETQREQIRLELENQRITAEANYAENLEERKTLIEEIKEHSAEVGNIEEQIADKQKDIVTAKQEIAKAEEEGSFFSQSRWESQLQSEEKSLQNLREMLLEEHDLLLEKTESLETTEKQLAQLDEIEGKMAQLTLAEVGINGTREDGVALLDEAIKKEQEQIAKAKELKGEQGELNSEVDGEIARREAAITKYKSAKSEIEGINGVQADLNDKIRDEQAELEAVGRQFDGHKGKIDANTSAQSGTNAKIDEGKAKAGLMNEELAKDTTKDVNVTDNGTIADIDRRASKPVTKTINVRERVSTTENRGSNARTRHTGGPAGRPQASDFIPQKLHTGGQPQFNEVDVRLLRNEMVLTEGQQARLFSALQRSESVGSVGGTSISMAETNALLNAMMGELANLRDLTVMLDTGVLVGELEPGISTQQAQEYNFSRTFNGDRGT